MERQLLVLCFLSLRVVFAEDDGMLDLASLFSGLNGGDGCSYQCPGGIKPTPRAGHKPTSNGCGSGGLSIDVSNYPDFVACCDAHDYCYDTCGESRAKCDSDFRKCMEGVCFRYKSEGRLKSAAKKAECDQTAGMMYGGTVGFGCAAYLESQKSACDCKGDSHIDLWHTKLFTGTSRSWIVFDHVWIWNGERGIFILKNCFRHTVGTVYLFFFFFAQHSSS